MISRRTQENLIACAFLAIFLGVILMSLDFGPRARLVPLPVATFGVIMILIQLVWQNTRPIDELQMSMFEALTKRGREAKKEEPEERQGSAPTWPEWVREAMAYGIVAAIVALILLLGPITAVFVFSVAYFPLSGHTSWGRGVVYSALLTGCVYLLFGVALEIQLYHGILEPVVEYLFR